MRILSTLLLGTSIAIVGAGCTIVATQGPVNRPAAAVSTIPNVAMQGDLVPIENWTTTLLTARSVPRVGDVREISDNFSFEGRIFAHATLTSEPGSNGGHPSIEMRWYNGDKLVSVKKMEPTINTSPYYMVASTSGTAIGPGRAHVDLLANGKLMASKAFVVFEN